MEWTRILAYITGSVDQELLVRNEYLAAENRILRAKLNRRLRFSDAERSTLGQIGFRLGRTALSEVATVAQPDTILAWYRRLVAHKFDGSQARRGPGRPRIDQDVEGLIVRMAKENRPSDQQNGSRQASAMPRSVGRTFAVLSSRGSVNWLSGCGFIDAGRCLTGGYSKLTI